MKRTLILLEERYNGALPKEHRKIVVDGFNDMARDILKELGYAE